MGSRRRSITTFAVGATAGAAVCALVTTGMLHEGAGFIGSAARLVRVPAAVADELPAFADCQQLRRWYVETALPQVGPWGLGGGPVVPMLAERNAAGLGAPQAGSPQGQDDPGTVGSSGTGTNVQEADVDESDVAKTDGRIVVRILGRELVVTDVSTGHPRELSRTTLPGPALLRPELLLREDRVVVVGDEQQPSVPEGLVEDSARTFMPPRPSQARAHLVSFDISDPAAPRVTDDRTVDGGAVSTREYADGTVRVVVTTGFPDLDFVQPDRDRTPAEATRLNRRLVRSAPIERWLPGVRPAGGTRQPLLDCSEVRHPWQDSGFGTISVLTFPFADPAGYDATAVTAAGDLVYSSASRLYVATTEGRGEPVPVDVPARGAPAPLLPSTEVHAFALDGGRTSYVASGSFRGLVADRWSFSEYDGHLRVAAELGPHDGSSGGNGVVVLDEHGGRLTETGRLDGLGPGEDIRSVRWYDDLAIVVTFRTTDPLYTVDLADPARPRLVGALKIPGFSSYLHPVGGDLLVGVGHDVSAATGADLGAQAATFDLRNLRAVRRVDTLGLGPDTDVSASLDPRTFTYLPERGTLVTPVQDWAAGRSRFVALHVAPDGTLTPTGSWVTRRYAGEDVRTLPLGPGRIALVGDVVRVVDVP